MRYPRKVTTKLKVLLLITLSLLALDQVTKIWIVQNLKLHSDEIHIIPGFLSFIHAQNPNAAMGLGSFLPQPYRLILFGIFTVIAIGMLVQMYRQLPDEDRFHATTIGLILSGAIGNAIDRVHKQSVTDFIRVYTENASLKSWLIENFGTNEWPTFNIADAAIVVGVAFYLIGYLFEKDQPQAAESPPQSDQKTAQMLSVDDGKR